MQHLKKILRLVGLTILIVLAMTGIGFFGALFNSREKYENKPMNIEMKEEKRDEDEGDEE